VPFTIRFMQARVQSFNGHGPGSIEFGPGVTKEVTDAEALVLVKDPAFRALRQAGEFICPDNMPLDEDGMKALIAASAPKKAKKAEEKAPAVVVPPIPGGPPPAGEGGAA